MMKAVFFKKIGRELYLQDLPIPEVDADSVLVKVLASGICGTDVHIVDGHLNDVVQDVTQMGHEVYVEVVDIGVNAQNIKRELSVGQRAIVQPIGQCNRCEQCLIGSYNHCRYCLTDHLGYTNNGGWAHYILLEPKRLVPYPDEASKMNLPPSLAVLAEPLACILTGFRRIGYIPSGANILIIGGGILGLLSTLALHFRGNRAISVSEVNEQRLKMIEEMSLTGVQVLSPDDLTNQSYKSKFQVIVDCSGSFKAVENCFYNASVKAKILLLGISSKECLFNISLFDVMSKELDIFGSFANRYTLNEACSMILDMFRSNLLSTEKLGIQDYSLEDYLVALKDSRERKVIKAVILPDGR